MGMTSAGYGGKQDVRPLRKPLTLITNTANNAPRQEGKKDNQTVAEKDTSAQQLKDCKKQHDLNTTFQSEISMHPSSNLNSTFLDKTVDYSKVLDSSLDSTISYLRINSGMYYNYLLYLCSNQSKCQIIICL